MAEVRKIAVIGGGIVGTCTALLALEKIPNLEITLISEKFSPYTTGDGSAGFLKPYLLGKVPENKLRFWCEKTFEFFQNIFQSANAKDYGVGLLSVYELFTDVPEEHLCKDVYPNWRIMSDKELAVFPTRYQYGVFLTTYFVECTKLLPLFLKKFAALGGKVIKKKINNLGELHGKYDIVINCCGLGAADLVSDSKVIPIRGQVIRVQAPWIKHAVMDEEFYILPNSEEIICGGTHQDGNWNLNVDPVDSKKIWNGCTELVPSLKKAKIVREWVGLRPGRFEPRLERETLKTEKGDLEVIHNYGHGGSGITIGWGCAHEVVEILEDTLIDINLKKLTSNL